MELRATLLGNHARNVRARNARARARNVRARARDAGSTSARQLAAAHSPALHATSPTHCPPHAHCRRTLPTHTERAPASSHGDMGRGRGQVRD